MTNTLTDELVEWLTKNTDADHVSTEVPSDRTEYENLITVERFDGGLTEFLEEAGYRIDVYAPTDAAAEELGMRVIEAAFELPQWSDRVSNVDCTSFYRNQILEEVTPMYSVMLDIIANRLN